LKKLLLIALAAIFLLSCHKNIEPNNGELSYLKNIKANLKDSLTASDYANLDFERSVVTKKDQESRFFRVPVVGKKFSEEFILLHTDTSGKILNGLIIQLHPDEATVDTKYQYN